MPVIHFGNGTGCKNLCGEEGGWGGGGGVFSVCVPHCRFSLAFFLEGGGQGVGGWCFVFTVYTAD